MSRRILLLTGMSPDERIFARLLPLLPNAAVVPWIEPQSNETISHYAARLADTIRPGPNCVVCGVSFGGIVAQELAHRVSADCCVLISSIRGHSQLPPWFRVLRYFTFTGFENILAAAGRIAKMVPRRVRTGSTTRLAKFVGPDGAWYRWATSAVLRWDVGAKCDSVPIVQIHGDSDSTFPFKYILSDVVIPHGGHVLPLTHASQIAAIIRSYLKNGPASVST